MNRKRTLPLSQFDMKANFWKLYPSYAVAGHFKNLYEGDKSKDKKRSSEMMWFIALCYDPGSDWRKLDKEEKHQLIGVDFLGDAQYYEKNKDSLDLLIPAYVYNEHTEAERTMIDLMDKLRERSRFLKETPYSIDNATALDKMLADTKKIFDEYKRIMEMIANESGEGTTKGGKELSLSEQGLI